MYKDIEFEIIFEDDNLVAINKPAGLLTIPDRYNKKIPCLSRILEDKYGKIFVVHRLDKETSGLMIFAKNPETHKNLNTQFQEKQVQKIYHAVVGGVVGRDKTDVDIPLLPNPFGGAGVIPSARGKESLTIVTVIERFRSSTFVECNLVTGRHHQLRAHVAAMGHPLLIDDLYGENTEFMLSSIKRKFNMKKHDVERPIISRITMHAFSLDFIHPINNEKMHLEAEYPKDFRVLLQVLRKYSSIN